jgi:hypothetical protein
MKDYELRAVSHLTLDHRDGNDLVIKAWVGDELLMERLLTASQLPCREGHVIYHRTEWYFGGIAPFFPVIAHSSIDHLISLASDGSLVMQNHEFSKGAATVVPLAVKTEYWYRFPPTPPNSPSLINKDTRPRGVRTETTPAYRLLPPEDAPEWSGYKEAGACLDQAYMSEDIPDAHALALLRGRSTQAFIVQNGRDGALSQNGTVVGNNWIPATHSLQVEKQHWQSPAVADRYVICLLKKGYRWEEHIK